MDVTSFNKTISTKESKFTIYLILLVPELSYYLIY